jgi:hypothetical protein
MPVELLPSGGRRPLVRVPLRIWALTSLALLWAGNVGMAASARTEGAIDAFGRWERTLRHCRIERTPAGRPGAQAAPPTAVGEQRCQRLRLDQQAEGLLVVRWVSAAAGSRYASRQLVFAGLLDQASPPLRCTPEGLCRPAGTMAVWVSVVAESGFGHRGLALALPSTRRAKGLCRLEPRRFRCEATDDEGMLLRAEGTP